VALEDVGELAEEMLEEIVPQTSIRIQQVEDLPVFSTRMQQACPPAANVDKS
jgi:hypothetical protein